MQISAPFARSQSCWRILPFTETWHDGHAAMSMPDQRVGKEGKGSDHCQFPPAEVPPGREERVEWWSSCRISAHSHLHLQPDTQRFYCPPDLARPGPRFSTTHGKYAFSFPFLHRSATQSSQQLLWPTTAHGHTCTWKESSAGLDALQSNSAIAWGISSWKTKKDSQNYGQLNYLNTESNSIRKDITGVFQMRKWAYSGEMNVIWVHASPVTTQ